MNGETIHMWLYQAIGNMEEVEDPGTVAIGNTMKEDIAGIGADGDEDALGNQPDCWSCLCEMNEI